MFIVTWWTKPAGYQVACFFKEAMAELKLAEVKALTDSWGCDLTNTSSTRTEVCKGT